MRSILRDIILSDLDKLHEAELKLFPIDFYTKNTYRRYIQSNKNDLFLIENIDNNDIIAWGQVTYRKNNKTAHITAVAVLPQYEGKGFGKQILENCEKYAINRGCNKIKLEVRENNDRAISLYEKNGYIFKKIKFWYYKDKTNAFSFKKRLSS